MKAYSFHHDNEGSVKRIARLGERDGQKACKRLAEFVERNFPSSGAVEVTISKCFMN